MSALISTCPNAAISPTKYSDMLRYSFSTFKCGHLTHRGKPCSNKVRLGGFCSKHRQKNLPETLFLIQSLDSFDFLVQFVIKDFIKPPVKILLPSKPVRLQYQAMVHKVLSRNIRIEPSHPLFSAEINWFEDYLKLHIDNHRELMSNHFVAYDLKLQLKNEFNLKHKHLITNYDEAFRIAELYIRKFRRYNKILRMRLKDRRDQ